MKLNQNEIDLKSENYELKIQIGKLKNKLNFFNNTMINNYNQIPKKTYTNNEHSIIEELSLENNISLISNLFNTNYFRYFKKKQTNENNSR